MSTIDPAFLWETEALRERRTAHRTSTRIAEEPGPPEAEPDEASAEHGFVTLVAASEETGIPVNTLRKWARRGAIVSYLDETGPKPVRMVSIDAVRSRAAALGREISALAAPPTLDPHTRLTVDLTRVEQEDAAPALDEDSTGTEAAPDGASEPKPTGEASSEGAAAAEFVSEQVAATRLQATAVEPPPGTMIVPISAWEKMLLQLGNLHEAGKEMAEARERAAKAETEAVFLRERLKELRAELEDSRTSQVTSTQPVTAHESPDVGPQSPDSGGQPEKAHSVVAAPGVERIQSFFGRLRRRLRGG